MASSFLHRPWRARPARSLPQIAAIFIATLVVMVWASIVVIMVSDGQASPFPADIRRLRRHPFETGLRVPSILEKD
jgi:hypothetical protein